MDEAIENLPTLSFRLHECGTISCEIKNTRDPLDAASLIIGIYDEKTVDTLIEESSSYYESNNISGADTLIKSLVTEAYNKRKRIITPVDAVRRGEYLQ